MKRLNLSPLTESATLLRRAAVVLGSVGLTAIYSLLVLLRALFGRLNRPIVDKYCREWSAALLKLVRASLTVRGEVPDFNDGRRYIIMSTHASHYDIPVSFVSLPGSIRMLAKKELFRIPLLGQAMAAAEFPSIDRSNRIRAVRDLERAKQMMENGIVLWAAPEGTRSSDGTLLPFKKGCFHLALDTEAVIVPVAIRGIHQVLPARSLQINLGQPVDVRVGTPIETAGKSKEDLAQIMSDVHQSLEQLLGDGEPE
ncbi:MULTISPECIES: lysophospholipid acyltransferase family protein [Marinobacter]|jgi:1-acyl-sn-glycerol-3-phosphate acyltransferase|uniref:1-acyl-sn-glycerol-3-phosphate acyltransferase n=1 Tax=Marinobacter excellens LAMA 842 TaxID=1306954 RepID=A0A137SHZ4_9GAMM|nr:MULTISPECIES: lysophospholipid acyltransferase family protein [Marinobacter]KXO12062.1 1-acyl-sn-glycerol-3-phosphate acyltransferase [Marinobacter excellens LAMA 842]MCD1630974.1 1-acyl-sn-glycerol-3-phosphate acyltransferase [Marinobacter shengliensis]